MGAAVREVDREGGKKLQKNRFFCQPRGNQRKTNFALGLREMVYFIKNFQQKNIILPTHIMLDSNAIDISQTKTPNNWWWCTRYRPMLFSNGVLEVCLRVLRISPCSLCCTDSFYFCCNHSPPRFAWRSSRISSFFHLDVIAPFNTPFDPLQWWDSFCV